MESSGTAERFIRSPSGHLYYPSAPDRAMADVHFVIEKSSTDDMTITDIHKVSAEESLAELARLLGSDALTEAALSNAKEMKEQAGMFKETR